MVVTLMMSIFAKDDDNIAPIFSLNTDPYNPVQQGSLGAWRTVFLVSAANYVVTTTLYMLTMSAQVQPWNHSQKSGG